jgi:hypothetical protein
MKISSRFINVIDFLNQSSDVYILFRRCDITYGLMH